MRVLDIRATTSLDDDYQPVRTSLDPNGLTSVLSTASFVVKLDRYALPSTAIRQSICIQADLTEVRTFEDCATPVALQPAYDPVTREIVFRRDPDEARLTPGAEYAVTVFAPADESAVTGLRAFDGAPLEGNLRRAFVVAAADPPEATDELPPGGDLFCKLDPESGEQIGAFSALRTCGFGGCHGYEIGAAGEVLERPAMGLNLSTNVEIAATAVARVAHHGQTGEHADELERSPLRFGRAMPIVDPGNPGNSYLLYKLLVGISAKADPEIQASDEEVARLRASVVTGMPMPPPPNSPLSPEQMRIVSAWIASGAETPACP